ncbi:MBL fold metallo-hydrolase [Thioalkalivibrio sp. ALJ24]|uniref:MBL fold metallo-hydrolase n=1 Tax=Thioalkalivibrio sp. ALJ24 TaxID=545276 RepID=UPI00036CB277|nr:3',5'-cyclic-nucleotide phosphodiesterase [Thioalkalivibrio sp. ALJ24]
MQPERSATETTLTERLDAPAPLSVRILGASGGIGPGRRTTSILIDDDVLIDAGSGVGDLHLEELGGIRHVFLTHSHLDHVAFLPFLIDTVFRVDAPPITVHALADTLEALQRHIFNWVIWPDFTALPSPERPSLRLQTLEPGEAIKLGNRTVTALPARHTVPAIGYSVVRRNGGAFAFSGDTTSTPSFWETLNALPSLDLLMIETGLPDEMDRLAGASRHYTPLQLAHDLGKLVHRPRVAITHLKPGYEQAIRRQLAARDNGDMIVLGGDERFELQAPARR